MATLITPTSIDTPSWSEFIERYGTIPQITDEKKPWEYPGWLMYYRVIAEDYLPISQRWDYWYRTHAAGKLLDEQIPNLEIANYESGERTEGYRAVDKWMSLADEYSSTSPLHNLLDWLLWGFGLNSVYPTLSEKAQEDLYRQVDLRPLLLKPYDYLGQWIAGHKGKWNPHAFFPTPHTVCHLMTEINFTGIPHRQSRGQSVCDPAVGSGRLLLHASNHSLRLYGMDIDLTMVKVAKVNGALYVPWLVRPFPNHFFDDQRETVFGVECKNTLKDSR
jgi:hypothetical protein